MEDILRRWGIIAYVAGPLLLLGGRDVCKRIVVGGGRHVLWFGLVVALLHSVDTTREQNGGK